MCPIKCVSKLMDSMALEFVRQQRYLVPTSDDRKANTQEAAARHSIHFRQEILYRNAVFCSPLLDKRTQGVCPRLVNPLEIDGVWNQKDGHLCSVRIRRGLYFVKRLFKTRDIHAVVIVVARIGAQPPPIQP